MVVSGARLVSRYLTVLGLLAAAQWLGGCATAPSMATDRAVFRESSADVVNRAPASLSLPSETSPGGSTVVDPVYLHTQADYHFTLAESLSLAGNSKAAVEEYRQTLIYDSHAQTVRLRLAAEYVKQGLVSEAIEQAKAVVEEEPKHEDAHLLLGSLYSAIRSYDDALSEYKTVLNNNPQNEEAPMFVGALLAEQKKYSEALAQFDRLAHTSGNANANLAWYYMGRVYLEQSREKNRDKAEAAYRQAVALKPKHVESTLALGQLLESTERQKDAVALYQVYQDKYGPNVEVADDLSRLYIFQKNYAKAYEQLAIIEANDATNINVKSKMAFILIEQKKYKEAIQRLEEVLAAEPASDKIRFYLGAVYEELHDYKSAVSQFEKVPVVSSYYREAVVHSAFLCKTLGNYEKAVTTVEAGIKSDSDYPQFYALYASLLDDQKQYSKAAEMLTQATEKFPSQVQLLFFLGNMQDRLGQKDQTISTMKKVLALDHDHVQALNFLAYVYADLGRELDEAEKFARHALELQPKDGYIMDTLGWVLFKRGQTPEAIRLLEAAYAAQPNESVIAEHLGDVYYHQQMPEKAKQFYRHAVETESNVSLAEKLREKLAAVDLQADVTRDEAARLPASTASPASDETTARK